MITTTYPRVNENVGHTQNGLEGEESPLDVLSRAATMLQQETEHQDEIERPSSLPEEEPSTPPSPPTSAADYVTNKQTTKWKRDRRARLLPEYTRSLSRPAEGEAEHARRPGEQQQGDSPIDMRVRQRGLPPSYAQTMSNPEYRVGFRPTAGHANGREQLPSGISMCDPIIDEHFRRSLGDDYHTLFKNNSTKEKEPVTKPQKVTTSSVIEMMDCTGLSVDDHFAKALGDTWVKLNQKDDMKSSNPSENNLVSISN